MKKLVCYVLFGCLFLTQTLALATDLSDRLKTNHYVLLMRHAYAPGVGDPPGYSLEKCETQRTLNEEGRAQARRIGNWLRSQGVQTAQVHASIWCRCQETAELISLGKVHIEPALASFFDEPEQAKARNFALQRFISQSLNSKGSDALILVTHHVNIREFLGENIGSGDMVLAKVNPKGQLVHYKLLRSP